jgi:hypothetical protein
MFKGEFLANRKVSKNNYAKIAWYKKNPFEIVTGRVVCA